MNKPSLKIEIFLASAILAVALVVVYQLKTQDALGSVSRESQYHALFTSQGGYTNKANAVVSTVPGTLGQVTISGVNSGVIYLFDATTTDMTMRANVATTSLTVLAQFPMNMATGTYTLDVAYTKGLVIDIQGTVPTSTISWRE